MKLLYLPAYYYPERSAGAHLIDDRNKAFIDGGFLMEIVTATPCRGLSKEERKRYYNPRKEIFFGGKLTILRFRMFAEGKNPLLRFFRYLLCFLNQFHYAKSVVADCVFLASTPPIQGVLGGLIKRRKGIPFVYNLQDVFPDSLVGAGLAKKGGVLWRIGRRIEDFTYRNADKIIVISQDIKRNIMAKGVPESKIEVIYNWVDAEAVRPVNRVDNPLFEEFNLNKELFTVVYAGNLGNAQNIDIILSAAYMLPKIQFAIFGKGGQEDEIRNRIAKDSLSNVHLLPLQPMERVSYVYSLGDACIVSCKAGLGGSAMPSKTWSIMSCGRPVIANFDEGELKDILEENDCGVFSHAGNIQEFVDSIKLLAENHARCEEMGRNARQFILDNLTKEVGTQKYVDVIKQFEKQ